MKLHGPVQKAVAPERIPHVTMMRAIQMRAPIFSRIRLLGTSNRQ